MAHFNETHKGLSNVLQLFGGESVSGGHLAVFSIGSQSSLYLFTPKSFQPPSATTKSKDPHAANDSADAQRRGNAVVLGPDVSPPRMSALKRSQFKHPNPRKRCLQILHRVHFASISWFLPLADPTILF